MVGVRLHCCRMAHSDARLGVLERGAVDDWENFYLNVYEFLDVEVLTIFFFRLSDRDLVM